MFSITSTFARSLGSSWKTETEGRGFQHLLRDLENVNAWKTMFDPYIDKCVLLDA